MRPSRIIVGEVREAESLDMLIALNAGVPGMCTLHANSAREALTKLCTLPAARRRERHRRVRGAHGRGRRRSRRAPRGRPLRAPTHREIVAVPGRVENGVVETAEVFCTRGGRLVRGSGFPPHPERYAATGVDLVGLLAGEA